MINQMLLFACCENHGKIPSVVSSTEGWTKRLWVSCAGICTNGKFVICCDECLTKDRRPQFKDRYMILSDFQQQCIDNGNTDYLLSTLLEVYTH